MKTTSNPTPSRPAIARLFALAEESGPEKPDAFNLTTQPMLLHFAKLREENGLAALLMQIKDYFEPL